MEVPHEMLGRKIQKSLLHASLLILAVLIFLDDHVPLGLRFGNREMNTNNVSFAFHNGHQSLQKATA